VEQGILLAIVLSIIAHIAHSYRPYDRLLAIAPDGRVSSASVPSATEARPGLVIYVFGASLYYANTTHFTAEILDLAGRAAPPLKWFCLSAAAMGDVDYSGADAIRVVVEELAERGVTLVISDVDPEVQALLDAYGLTDKIGKSNIYPTIQDVIEAYQRNEGQPGI
jgi:MFS superfamily sulfate permease-like transporter